jgi:hypothetical protein
MNWFLLFTFESRNFTFTENMWNDLINEQNYNNFGPFFKEVMNK